MTPAPANEHQRILDELLFLLMTLLRRTGRGTVRSGINVFDETSPLESYRIPDLTFVATGREALFAEDGIRGGGPDAVIEIRSPEDETYDKLPFFARLGVREVIVVQRDTKEIEIYRLTGHEYVAVFRDPHGWLRSEVLQLRFTHGNPDRLIIEDLDDSSTQVEI